MNLKSSCSFLSKQRSFNRGSKNVAARKCSFVSYGPRRSISILRLSTKSFLYFHSTDCKCFSSPRIVGINPELVQSIHSLRRSQQLVSLIIYKSCLWHNSLRTKTPKIRRPFSMAPYGRTVAVLILMLLSTKGKVLNGKI